jgi:flavin-dependent dehydrogenase
MRYDVIVIGGSLAGAACVRELRRLGIDAVAFERERFPRDKVCGGFVSPGGVRCLERLGLLHDVLAIGAVEVTSARLRAHSTEVEVQFKSPGLGISRTALDDIVARGAGVEQHAVERVLRKGSEFMVDDTASPIVIDAAGKLSRFTRRRTADEFGIQYTQDGDRNGVLEFSFFEDGYGGSVSVEGGRSNSCFLIRKRALPKYLAGTNRLVTGPLAYDRLPGEFIAIGDAAGMVDPFCGDGMHHALDTGMLAARIVAAGIRSRASYEQMKWEYDTERHRRWKTRRLVGASIRRLLRHRQIFSRALSLAPAGFLNRVVNDLVVGHRDSPGHLHAA